MRRKSVNKIKNAASIADWHSSLGMDALFNKREVRIAATQENLLAFTRFGNILINKSNKQLWQFDEQKNALVKLFDEGDVPLKLEIEEKNV